MKVSVGIVSLVFLFCLQLSAGGNLIKNGSFEQGLAHWTVKGIGSVDKTQGAFGKSSLQIRLAKPVWQRVFQSVDVEPGTEYVLSYYVKCSKVVPKKGARFAGAGSWISKKKYFPHHGSAGPWKLDRADGSWRKVSYKFKTDKEDKKIAVQFQLSNASGTVWIDQVTLEKVKGSSPDKKYKVTLALYPIEFLKSESFAIAENLTASLKVKVHYAKRLQESDKAEMILDVPEFIRVTGGVPNLAMQRGRGKDPRRQVPTYKVQEVGKVKRKGKTFRRFRLLFDSNFRRLVNASWYRHFAFFRAEKGSAGKVGPFYCYIVAGKERSAEKMGVFKVIPPVIHKAPACKHFAFMFGRPSVIASSDMETKKENLAFWKSMALDRYSWVRPCDMPLEGFRPIITVGGGVWTVVDSVQKELAALRKILPKNINDKGRPHHGYSNWSKLDDKSGLVEQIYYKAAKEIAERQPDARDVVWDFEPHPYGYDQGGRERFARVMKLKKIPSISEINSKYRTAWFNYMVKLHAQYARKFITAFKKAAPHLNFQFCSDNLYASAPHISSWCGVDVRLSDDVTDGHMHMPYYAGKRFFDDCQFNIQNLKKPFFPLIDPAEAIYSFYRQYTPAKVEQNILAVASLGGRGIGFWPNDAFSAYYAKAISRGFSLVSAAEEFYKYGKRVDKEFRVTPVNVLVKDVKASNGRNVKLFFPDFPADLRKTVHAYKSDVLFTLFNYNEKDAMILELKGRGRTLYVKVPPSGVETVRLSEKQDASVLKELKEFRTKSSSAQLQEIRQGNASLQWGATDKGSPCFQMKNSLCSASVDLLKDGRIISLVSSNGSELLRGGFLGWLMFYDARQQEVVSRIHSMKILKGGVPELVLKGVVGPYAGANPVPNQLLDLEIYRKYTLRGNVLSMEYTFFNPTKKDMTLGFRLNNYPHPGTRFGAEGTLCTLSSGGKIIRANSGNNLFARKGAVTPFTKGKSALWDGGPITVTARKGSMEDTVKITADQKFAGVMCWFGMNYNTVELLTDSRMTVPAGKRVTLRYDVTVSSK